jgi:hypothetical protein
MHRRGHRLGVLTRELNSDAAQSSDHHRAVTNVAGRPNHRPVFCPFFTHHVYNFLDLRVGYGHDLNDQPRIVFVQASYQRSRYPGILQREGHLDGILRVQRKHECVRTDIGDDAAHRCNERYVARRFKCASYPWRTFRARSVYAICDEARYGLSSRWSCST